ncbi:MAG: hypothetical protein JST20_01295, partial [Bacteroidetes bacterium]|nr:hypothetical protein [Bacteroidota bacterium]
SYDLWGDAVNTASRMESHGEPGKIHVSAEFVANINKSVRCNSSISFILDERRRGAFVERGEINIKGKGLMKTYFLEEIP